MSKVHKDTKPEPIDITSLGRRDRDAMRAYKLKPILKKKSLTTRKIKKRRDRK